MIWVLVISHAIICHQPLTIDPLAFLQWLDVAQRMTSELLVTITLVFAFVRQIDLYAVGIKYVEIKGFQMLHVD